MRRNGEWRVCIFIGVRKFYTTFIPTTTVDYEDLA